LELLIKSLLLHSVAHYARLVIPSLRPPI
jgi:hypothetical protein